MKQWVKERRFEMKVKGEGGGRGRITREHGEREEWRTQNKRNKIQIF